MLGKFLDRLDGKLYASWQKEAEKLVELTNQALEKINITPPTPKEIQDIKDTLAVLRAGNLAREQFVKLMKTVDEKFTQLSLNKEFNNPLVNDFIWYSARSYTMLNAALLTEYNKYGEAILNPAGKEQEKGPKVGFIENRLLGKGARTFTDYLLLTYEAEAAALYKVNVEKINATSSINVDSPIDISSQKGEPSLLMKKMGKENYQATQCAIQIKVPEDAGVYLAEQLHGKAYEAFYSQVATLYGIKSTIKKLAALGKTPEEIENEKQRLYREAGISELQSKESKKYFDTIATALGFKNAKELYNNFQQLDKPEGYSLYKQMKSDFTSCATKDIPASEDPLEIILKETSIENARIKGKLTKGDYGRFNNNYAGYISTMANELSTGIVNAQRSRNIVQLIAQDYLANQGQNVGLFGNLALYAADKLVNKFNFKEYLDLFLLGKLSSANSQLLRRMNDNTAQMNQRWLEESQTKFAQKKEQRNKLLHKAMSQGIDNSRIVESYIDAMLAYKKDFKRYNQANTELDHNSGSYIAIKNEFRKSETDYNNFREAFTLAATQSIYQLTQDNIDNHIAQREDKLVALQAEMDTKVKAIDALQRQIQERENENNQTVGGRFRKFGDKIASFFGIKTSRVKTQEEDKARLEALYKEIEPIGLALHVQRELFQKATEQKTLIVGMQAQNSVTLAKSINALNQKYYVCFEKLMNDFLKPIDAIDAQSVFANNQAFNSLENQLLISLKALTAKLDDRDQFQALKNLSVSELEDILNQCTQLQKRVVEYHKILSGDTKAPELTGLCTAVSNKVATLIQEKKQLAQEKQLANAKEFVSSHYAQFSVEKLMDPFRYVDNLAECNINELTTQSIAALRQHTHSLAVNLLKDATTLPLKDLEQLYSNYQSLIYQYANKDEVSTADKKQIDYYQELSNIVKQKMNAEYRKVNDLPISLFKDKLPDLGSELLYYKNQVESAEKNAESVKKTMESWIWNLFGLTTMETYRAALGNSQAAKLLLDNYAQEYTSTLEAYLNKVAPLFDAFDYEDLTQLIESLEKNNKILAQNGVSLEKAEQLMQSIITKAQAAKESHIQKSEIEIEAQFANYESKFKEIRILSLIIEKDLAEHDTIPVEKIGTYNTLSKQLEQHILDTKKSLKSLDAKREKLVEKYEALGEKHFSDEMLRKQFTARLEKLEINLEELNSKNITTYSFYETIMKGNIPEITPSLDNKILGKGLILSLQSHNHKAAKALLDFKHSARRVDNFELSVALPIAAKMGSLDIVQLILNYQDMSFSMDHLNQAFREALNSGQEDIMDYLIFYTDFKPDSTTAKAIVESIENDDPAISGIKRGWMQLVADNDGATLQNIRPWFIYLKQKCDSLALEAKILKDKAAHGINPDGTISADFKNDLNQFMKKLNKILELKDSSSGLFQNTFFDNPQRKNEHLKEWEENIDEVLTPYHKMIAQMLSPPPTILKEPMPVLLKEELTTLQEIEIERELNQVRVQQSFMQKLAQDGVIIPQEDAPAKPIARVADLLGQRVSLMQEAKLAPKPDPVPLTQEGLTDAEPISLSSSLNNSSSDDELSELSASDALEPDLSVFEPDAITQSSPQAKGEQQAFESRDHALVIKEQLEQLLAKRFLDSPYQLAELETLLTQYKHLTKDEKPDVFNSFVQKAIYKMAAENKVEALDELFGFVHKDTLQDIGATALSQAIKAEQTACVRYLLKTNAAIGHEAELLKATSSLIDSLEMDNSRGRNGLALVFELLTHTKFRLIDPSTKKLDERLVNLVSKMQSTNTSTKINDVSGGSVWSMLRDNDKPKLDKLREAYVFAEYAYREVSNSNYFDFMDKLILADPYQLSEREVNYYEQRLKQVEATYEGQLNAIAKLKALYKTLYSTENFDNNERKEQNVRAWEEQTHKLQEHTKKEMEGHINNCRETLNEARKVLAEKAEKATKINIDKSDKRQSVILSAPKRLSTPPRQDDAKQPSLVKKDRPKPPSL